MKVEATLSVTGTTCLVDTVCLSYWKYSCWWWRRRKVLARYSFPRDAWTPRPELDTLHNSSAACVNLPVDKLMRKDGERIIEVCCKAGSEDLFVSHVSLTDLLAMLRLTKRGDEAVLIFGLSGVMQNTGTRFTALFCNAERCGDKSGVTQQTLTPKKLPTKTVQGSEDEGVNAHQDNTEDRDDPGHISNPTMEEERESLTRNSVDEGATSTPNMDHTVTDGFYGSEQINKNQEYCTDDPEEDEDVYFIPRKTMLIKWWDKCMKQTTNPVTTPRQEEEITDQPRHPDNKNSLYTKKGNSNVYMEEGNENGLSKLANDEDGFHNDSSDESRHYVGNSDKDLVNEKDLDHTQDKDHTLHEDRGHVHNNNNYLGHRYNENIHQDHRNEDDDDHTHEKRDHRQEDDVDVGHGEEYRYYMDHRGEEDHNIGHSDHGNDLYMDHSSKEGFYMGHRYEDDAYIENRGINISCMDHESDDEDHSHGYKVHAGHRPQYMDHTSGERNQTCRNRRNTNGGRTYANKKDHYNINSNINTNMARRYDHNMYLPEDEGYINNMDQYRHHTPEERAYFGHSGTYWNYAKEDKVYTDYNNMGNISNTSRQGGCIRRRRCQVRQTRLPSYNQQGSVIKKENIRRRFWLHRPTSMDRSTYAYVRRVGLVVVVLLLFLYLIGLCWISW